MRVQIHRGANEIGGSCVEVEAGGDHILIDAGMPLTASKGTVVVPPKVDSGGLRAIIISHSHLDHYGLLPWMPSVPVAMGKAARRILVAAAPFMANAPANLAGPDLIDRHPLQIGSISITPFLVDHSAYDAYALLIEADGKRVFYSGDFRVHGRKRGLVNRLIASPPSDIDAMLLEGTTLGRTGDSAAKSEDDLEDDFEKVFRATNGLAMVHVSAQNIDRLVTIYLACLKTGRTLILDLYSALMLEATGNRMIPQSDWESMALCIPQRQRIQIKNNGWFESLNRHSSNRIYLKRHVARNPGAYVLLFRGLWMRDLDQAECLDGACLIHSQWGGYLKDEGFREIEAWRQAHDMEFHQLHTSGHASPADLKRFAAALRPKVLVPIHTDVPKCFDAFDQTVVCHADGEWWEV